MEIADKLAPTDNEMKRALRDERNFAVFSRMQKGKLKRSFPWILFDVQFHFERFFTLVVFSLCIVRNISLSPFFSREWEHTTCFVSTRSDKKVTARIMPPKMSGYLFCYCYGKSFFRQYWIRSVGCPCKWGRSVYNAFCNFCHIVNYVLYIVYMWCYYIRKLFF